MLDAMMVFSLTLALTGLFFWVLLEKGCLPALLVLLSLLIPIAIIVVAMLFKAIYELHGILGVIVLIFVISVLVTPLVIGIGILTEAEYGIDIFKWNISRFNIKPTKDLVKAGERRNRRNLRKAAGIRKAVEKSKGKATGRK